MNTYRLRQTIYGGIIGISSFVAVIFVIVYLHTQGLDAPKSLQDVLGPTGSTVWIWAIGVTLILCGLLAFIYNTRAMWIESVLRVIAVFPLFGYGVALSSTDKVAWITVGLVVAMGILQIARWFDLTFFRIPDLETRLAIEKKILEQD